MTLNDAIFTTIDVNQDGLITPAELLKYLADADYDEAVVKRIISGVCCSALPHCAHHDCPAPRVENVQADQPPVPLARSTQTRRQGSREELRTGTAHYEHALPATGARTAAPCRTTLHVHSVRQVLCLGRFVSFSTLGTALSKMWICRLARGSQASVIPVAVNLPNRVNVPPWKGARGARRHRRRGFDW